MDTELCQQGAAEKRLVKEAQQVRISRLPWGLSKVADEINLTLPPKLASKGEWNELLEQGTTGANA